MSGFKRGVWIDPEPGDFVSVWHRESRKHKFRCELSLVRVVAVYENSVTIQTSDSYTYTGPGYSGATSMLLRGAGTWERELRAPVYDIKEAS